MTSSTRKAISKKTRFEVFKRDGFKCMYCGAEAPKVMLQVDHINPVASGGKNDLLNLISSCEPCNNGKRAKPLSDDTAIVKQRTQLEELNARREQMEMMLAWRDGMADIASDSVKAARDHFKKVVPGWALDGDEAIRRVRLLVKKHGLQKMLEAIDVAADRYVRTDADGKVTKESAIDAWAKVGGILHIGSKSPEQQRLHYVKGILNKRLSYLPHTVMRDMEDALDGGASIDDMVEEAKQARTWTAFRSWLESRQAT